MNKFKGTPGEWFTGGDGIVRVKSDAGIMSDPPIKVGSGWREDCWCDGDATDESKANARLIAAAPDLLKELVHLLRLMEPLESAGSLDIPGLATLNGARSAIAKALQS